MPLKDHSSSPTNMIILIGDVVETASEVRGRWVSEFQVSQGYAMRPCLKRTTAEKWQWKSNRLSPKVQRWSTQRNFDGTSLAQKEVEEDGELKKKKICLRNEYLRMGHHDWHISMAVRWSHWCCGELVNGHINQSVCWVSAGQPEALFRQYPQQKARMALLSLSALTQKCPLNSVFRVDRASQRIIPVSEYRCGEGVEAKGLHSIWSSAWLFCLLEWWNGVFNSSVPPLIYLLLFSHL